MCIVRYTLRPKTLQARAFMVKIPFLLTIIKSSKRAFNIEIPGLWRQRPSKAKLILYNLIFFLKVGLGYVPVDVVDIIGAVVRVVYPLPAEGELVLVAVLWPLLLHPRQPGVEPVRGACGGKPVI